MLGKLPSRPDFVHYGLHEEPERVFRAWLEHAVLIAGGVLPNRAVRFVIAPRSTPVIGVWVPSRDAMGKPFPLVFMRRLRATGTGAATSDEQRRERRNRCAPRDITDLPWTLLLAGCAHYLSAAESCLLLGRSDSIANLWCRLEGLSLPTEQDLSELCLDAKRLLEREQLDSFANRNL
ncbi:MAG TPA: TagF domain-containing protein, partial [Polyangiales bacterium]|nr:TagF domain-containing protein [Polyangiales bacterium]